jgi:hypothetical protein
VLPAVCFDFVFEQWLVFGGKDGIENIIPDTVIPMYRPTDCATYDF